MDDDARLSADEWQPNAPLLGADAEVTGRSRKPWRPWDVGIAGTPRAISTAACIAMFLWVLSGMIVIVPAARLAEDIICRRHYGRVDSDDPIDETLCKAEAIQSSMAWIFGLSLALGTVVGLVADRARKPVYLLAATGQFANVAWSLLVLRFWRVLPLALILVGPALELVGGGLTMAIVVLYAIMSDVNAPEDRAITYFFSSLAANLAVFIGPPLASKLMEIWSPWVPISLSLVVTALAGAVILLIPETATISKKPPRGDDGASGVESQEWRNAITSRINHVFYNSDLRSVLSKRPMVLILLVFMLIAPLPSGMGSLFLQYYSKRFGKSIEDAGYMLAIRGGLTIVVVVVLLPVLSRYLGSSSCIRLSAFRRDLALAQASAACAGLGYFLLGGPNIAFLISGIVVLTLSVGIGPLCYSLISNLIEPDQMSQIFTIMSIVSGIGSLPSGPFLAFAFSSGMRLGGLWFGLPFFFLGCLGFVSLAALCLIRTESSIVDSRNLTENDYVQRDTSRETQLGDAH